jgi:cyclin-dependent kinase 2
MVDHKLDDEYNDENFSYDELNPLGSGSYGRVFSAKTNSFEQLVAIKRFAADVEKHEIEQEVKSTRLICKGKHPNIIECLGMYKNTVYNYHCIIFSKMNMSLYDYLKGNEKIGQATVKSILFQILQGLAYIHSLNLVHCDLKPGNVLIDCKDDKVTSVKIIDFGLSRPIARYDKWLNICTSMYRPPEICLRTCVCATSIDMWSFGCIFVEMFKGERLFSTQEKSNYEHLVDMFIMFGTPSQDTCFELTSLSGWDSSSFTKYKRKPWKEILSINDEDAIDLLEKIFQLEPSSRISAAEALKHKFFNDCHK